MKVQSSPQRAHAKGLRGQAMTCRAYQGDVFQELREQLGQHDRKGRESGHPVAVFEGDVNVIILLHRDLRRW